MAEQVLAENDFEDDFSDIDMEELDSYLTSPPGVAGAADSPAESARAAARARLAARAAHGEESMSAQAAAEAAVESVGGGAAAVNDENAPPGAARRSVFSRLDAAGAKTPSARALAAKRKHLISPPGKFARRKGSNGAGVNAARAARDLCGDLGEPKESLMRRAIECIGIPMANDLAIEVGAIEGGGGQMTADGSRRRTPGGVFWALLKTKVAKEDWDFIFEEEREVQRERCRRRQRAKSLANSNATSLAGSPSFRGGVVGMKTPAADLISNKLAGAADAAGATPGSRAVTITAPARPSLAERINGNVVVAQNNANAADTPAPAAAMSRLGMFAPATTTPPGSWAALAKAAAAKPAPAPAPAATPKPALKVNTTTTKTPLSNTSSTASDEFAVLTPDNVLDASVTLGGASYAARAKAAAALDAKENAVRAAAAEIKAKAKLAAVKMAPPAPAQAPVAVDDWAEDAEAADDDAMDVEEKTATATATAGGWGSAAASFASMLRA
ncbi:uncharacterized protein MICPUCDRAFT_69404 [Micromonas pusilla CCMP1545]|uniref:Phosphorylated adapter RNA export protein n=1 Tax=Micromonas pusilla (strain CCMP1545) TaxID=564608 RepID=C1MTY4_MICPC|nr:uncharacterized protein MICPUCDRAFT_69404 [Micromonas pusilla CCMP1545]EEH56535.1 predicted protein [Micromonas pusilla CCMP1545]|eukprot:XP_003059403.1 predicted protein [Micromonas pusilla CCMP1545]